MAYDAARGEIVMFGGSRGSFSFLGDTWTWNGQAWVQRFSAPSPSPRGFHAMVYDSTRQVVVLYGGYSSDGPSDETWEWNGSVWTQRQIQPPGGVEDAWGRYGHAMAFDSTRGVTVLFSGYVATDDQSLSETYEYDGLSWVRKEAVDPAQRVYHGMAFDPARGVTRLFGGVSSGRSLRDAWEWNGVAWTPVGQADPSARSSHAMYYDSGLSACVIFGGDDVNLLNEPPTAIQNNETWSWSSSAWTRMSVDGPAARTSSRMAYDVARQLAVLFGGYTTAPNAETWILDSTCFADIDNDGSFANGAATDLAVTVDDLLFFLAAFEAGSNLVDVDNGTFTGVRDGVVGIDDLLYFLYYFEAGC